MHRRLACALLWLALLPIVGASRLVWHLLSALAGLQPRTLLVLVGLVVALSLPNPVSALLAEAEVWPPGQVISLRLQLALGAVILYHGLRSPGLRRLWRSLQRRSR